MSVRLLTEPQALLQSLLDICFCNWLRLFQHFTEWIAPRQHHNLVRSRLILNVTRWKTLILKILRNWWKWRLIIQKEIISSYFYSFYILTFIFLSFLFVPLTVVTSKFPNTWDLINLKFKTYDLQSKFRKLPFFSLSFSYITSVLYWFAAI